MLSLMGNMIFSQWSPVMDVKNSMIASDRSNYYRLDFAKIKLLLKDAQEAGRNSKTTEISLPTLGGRMEKFAVYSFPVLVKDLADQYELGSYVGIGIDDPLKYVRFSLAPDDFQSMIIKNGETEYISSQAKNKDLYVVYPKSRNNYGFVCSTEENPLLVKQIQELQKKGQSLAKQPLDFTKSSDKKFRTYRLAISVNGEYSQYFGGTVSAALTAINATMTRVNGILEKDLAIHLTVQNFPQLIYTDPSTDPYSTHAPEVWNSEVQNVLNMEIGNSAYDIGHFFAGGGSYPGNAGGIGTVCLDPSTMNFSAKGAAFTASDGPTGEYFDLLVAHEFGHQLGAYHTFSYINSENPIEPGSGSTIMSYAGAAYSDDVQPGPDPYFHTSNIKGVHTILMNKTCGTETPIMNNPPVIFPLITSNIPKKTPFVLDALITDPENDPMTYTWEQVDIAEFITVNKDNLGNTLTGPMFRSIMPGASSKRYFPKLSSVLDGVLDNTNNGWESVSKIARTTKFAVTVRDNNPDPSQQQTQYMEQTIIVGDDGPFKINTSQVFNNMSSTVEWDIANTNIPPYNVSDVKIDYTMDNGFTWTILSNSTPNDGSENFIFPASLNNNQYVKLRISAINNVFYAIKKVIVTNGICENTTPQNIKINDISFYSAIISWDPIGSVTYQVRYKKSTDTSWLQTIPTTNTSLILNDLEKGIQYDIQIAAVCSGITGNFSTTTNFTTSTYCTSSSTSTPNDYIANVTLSNINNSSGVSVYTDYTNSSPLQINLIKGSSNILSVAKGWLNTAARPDAITVWIDFDNNGEFLNSPDEMIMIVGDQTTQNPVMGSFTVPDNAILNEKLRMRVKLSYFPPTNIPLEQFVLSACGFFDVGEVEDYTVVITDIPLTTHDINSKKEEIQLYPNPASDTLYVTNLLSKVIYKIYNTAGQLIDRGNIINGQIDISEIMKGEYIISLEDKGKNLFKSKFIKR